MKELRPGMVIKVRGTGEYWVVAAVTDGYFTNSYGGLTPLDDSDTEGSVMLLVFQGDDVRYGWEYRLNSVVWTGEDYEVFE